MQLYGVRQDTRRTSSTTAAWKKARYKSSVVVLGNYKARTCHFNFSPLRLRWVLSTSLLRCRFLSPLSWSIMDCALHAQPEAECTLWWWNSALTYCTVINISWLTALYSTKHTAELVSAHFGKGTVWNNRACAHTWNTNFLQAVYFIMKTVCDSS